ncbi:MAG: hypothetical protein WBD00_04165 [Candidatus Omnitrophota bacterium]
MIKALNKEHVFKVIIIVWLVLWVFFLIREDKDGQYKSLKYMYTHNQAEGMRHVYGEGLYDLVSYCADNMREGTTYNMAGFKRFSIKEVRARYLLWPFKRVDRDADYIVMLGGAKRLSGYKRVGEAGDGTLWIKRSVTR